MEKYQHATKNELDSILLRNNMINLQPDLFNNIYDSDGNIITSDQITKANEITGAGLEYLISYVEYACTHYKNKIKKNASTLYYEAPKVEWAAFLEIVTGGIQRQKERVERTVMQYHAKPKPVLMISNDGHLHSRQPFVLDFDWGNPDKLDAKAAARLARLNKTSHEKKDKDTETSLPRLPIDKVTIMFAKPLFEDFFRKNAGNYSFPTGMYAKFFNYANTIKRNSVKSANIHKENISIGVHLFDNDLYISAYARFARYIIRHNNLTASQLKDKNHYSVIRIPSIEFITSVYPSLISTNGRGERHIDKIKATYFLANAQLLYQNIDDFQFYPVIQGNENGKIIIGIYTDRDRAIKESLIYAQKMIQKK
jgi:hypothetical protein